jgi:hypothetical protein
MGRKIFLVLQVVKLDIDFGSSFSGVLVDSKDQLRALWASYSEQVLQIWKHTHGFFSQHQVLAL